MPIWRLGSSPGLCIVCCRKSNRVAICPSLRNGRLTCSRIIRALEPSNRSILSSLEKIKSNFPRKDFHKDCRRFLEDLVSTILSTVAACSPVGQGVSSFCPEIILGGDDFSAFRFFGQLLDGLLELGWVRRSEIEHAKPEFYSFVREQRQVEVSGKKSRGPFKSVSTFCSQPGLRSRQNLHKISIMVSRCSHDLTHMMLSDLSFDSISGEGSLRVAYRLYCVSRRGYNRP